MSMNSCSFACINYIFHFRPVKEKKNDFLFVFEYAWFNSKHICNSWFRKICSWKTTMLIYSCKSILNTSGVLSPLVTVAATPVIVMMCLLVMIFVEVTKLVITCITYQVNYEVTVWGGGFPSASILINILKCIYCL